MPKPDVAAARAASNRQNLSLKVVLFKGGRSYPSRFPCV